MKNRKITLRKSILVALIFTAMIGNATNELNNDPKNRIKKTTFSLNHVKTGNQLKIKDLNGIILYKEDIKTSGTYSKGFDLTSLPNESYVFELEKDLEIKSFPFTVTSQTVVFEKEETIIHKPFVTVKDNYIYVSKLALNEEPLDIKIYYQEASDLIYSEKVENTKNIQKIYKLKSTAKGDYKIVLTSNGREYYESITL
ncbi:MAG: hypothetical protein GW839_02165 [Flavobacteriales bacterium]|nr:hypothetical protein [Flavobacteriia bacterium]NCP04855.1 hypothetical protein [Flavobacteriales bacterium]PIV94297.1 MAG: hypothetical protein COW44_05130 [Flavobacteriaceae bacterium CG17_big_fil_post_rev_8_21_14_2_50_33_15]PIY11968.1 MAG: hypothetical protein COZ17_05095 [Flavobacteriaceae bacterium CG_4_10_14_3_um_filter_33_47]PJB16212.1 MAG: hypothetical protein CO117_15575 [Flavobacteriaceae bacterium CG_4_9_14_3_um_filter_33_16]